MCLWLFISDSNYSRRAIIRHVGHAHLRSVKRLFQRRNLWTSFQVEFATLHWIYWRRWIRSVCTPIRINSFLHTQVVTRNTDARCKSSKGRQRGTNVRVTHENAGTRSNNRFFCQLIYFARLSSNMKNDGCYHNSPYNL